jgi:hypothetical protein
VGRLSRWIESAILFDGAAVVGEFGKVGRLGRLRVQQRVGGGVGVPSSARLSRSCG